MTVYPGTGLITLPITADCASPKGSCVHLWCGVRGGTIVTSAAPAVHELLIITLRRRDPLQYSAQMYRHNASRSHPVVLTIFIVMNTIYTDYHKRRVVLALMNVTKAGIAVETVEPQKAADDGGSTFELVCGRKSNHLPLPGIGQDQPDGSPSSDVDHHVPILDKPPQNKRQDEQKSDTGYVSQQQSCSTDPNREEWVGGCAVFHRVGRPPVGMRAGPLPRCLLPVVQELARAGAGGRTASTAKR